MQNYKKCENQTNNGLLFYIISHQQALYLRNFHPSAMQNHLSIVLQPIKYPAYFETTVVDFNSQSVHQDMEHLRTCGIDTVNDEEPHDAIGKRS